MSLLHADAVEIWPAVGHDGVRLTGRAGLTNDVALAGCKGQWRGEIAAALQIVSSYVRAMHAMCSRLTWNTINGQCLNCCQKVGYCHPV